jgi:hypothetical protein
MEEEKQCCRPKFARVAWFNRDNKEHNYGTWQSMATTTPEEYSKLKGWIAKQNKKYPRTKYWIDIKDTEESLSKNSEVYELVPIVKSDSAYTEWLAL